MTSASQFQTHGDQHMSQNHPYQFLSMQLNPPRLEVYFAWVMINHRLERGVECILHGEITRLSRSISRKQGNDTQGVTNPSSQNALVDRCYLNYHWSQLIGQLQQLLGHGDQTNRRCNHPP